MLRPPGGSIAVFSTLFNKAVLLFSMLSLLKYQQVPQELRINTTTSGLRDLPPPPGTLKGTVGVLDTTGIKAPMGSVKLISTKLTNLVSLEQSITNLLECMHGMVGYP